MSSMNPRMNPPRGQPMGPMNPGVGFDLKKYYISIRKQKHLINLLLYNE